MKRGTYAKRYGCLAAWLLLSATQAPAQDGLIPHAQDKPPGPALSPTEALAKMKVHDGFQVELVTSEPDLVNPVAMTFDERGRIWVTESLEYPRHDPGPGRDRVKVFEDTDGDGKADKSTIFTEGLNIPSGIAVGHGGVWVANAPDILLYPDADRDAKPDGPPQVVVTGFGRDDTHELPNSLTWGPDGWLYGWNGVFNRAVIKQNGKTFDFTCAIWRIHPKTREFQLFCQGTSNPWGIAFNRDGAAFASACVIDHLWHLTESAYYIRQGGPYPEFTWPQPSIVDHLHQKAAYCGITYFDSAAYPEQFREMLYMGNIHGNCINTDAIEKNGSTYKCKGQDDFLSANDAWFMPVVQKTGPDGSLYVLDWYDRYHCYQDATRDPAGIDRLKGRLYRVRYKDTPRRVNFDLATETNEQLIERLGNANIYDREIAQRLLTERLLSNDDPATRKTLESLVLADAPPSEKGRRHALWVLAGAGNPSDDFLKALLSDDLAFNRSWGVRIAGNAGKASEDVRTMIAAMTDDLDADVRLQVAIAARKIEGIDVMTTLLGVLDNSEGDVLIPHVVWQNLYPTLDRDADRFVEITANGTEKWSQPLAALMPRVLDRLLGSERPPAKAIAALLATLANGQKADIDVFGQCVNILAAKIQNGELQGETSANLRNEVRESLIGVNKVNVEEPVGVDVVALLTTWKDPESLKLARGLVGRPKVGGEARIRLLAALVAAGDAESVLDHAGKILADKNGNSQGFRARILETLGKLDNSRVAEIVLTIYPDMEDSLQPKAVELLTQRTGWAKAMLKSVADKSIDPSALSVNQLRRLLGMNDPEIAKQVKATWGILREGRDPQRDLVIGQMRNFLRKTPGNPVEGQKVFNRVCGQCHKIYGEGQDVGPEITRNGRNDFEQMISNVFDPSLVIGEAYQATTVATADGRILTGLLAENSPQRIVLKTQGGKRETVARGDVDEIKVSNVSLMPEDLEKQLKPQEIADLFSFLALDKPPADPEARLLPGAPSFPRQAKP
jgi:putative heme-binding domain-containing protein